jgi:hypothetical protein
LSSVGVCFVRLARARLAWRAGDAERAHDLYSDVAALAKQIPHPELLARAWIGFSTLAQIRGDLAAVGRWSRRILAWTDVMTKPDIARIAVQGLMMVAVEAGKFTQAVQYGWQLYAISIDEPIARDAALGNLAQLLLDIGYSDASRAAFAAILTRRQPSRIGLPALGGFAVASAHARDLAGLRWSMEELLRVAPGANAPYSAVHALMECARALLSVGMPDDAVRCRDVAVGIAMRHGQPDLIARTHDLSPIKELQSPTTAHRKRVRVVVEHMEALRPESLPVHVELAAVAEGIKCRDCSTPVHRKSSTRFGRCSGRHHEPASNLAEAASSGSEYPKLCSRSARRWSGHTGR